MEPILDETSLVPCAVRSPAARIADLGQTLQALDRVGALRVLRSVRDAADRDIRDGRGLRGWCFDKETPRDAGLLVATRLGKQPFIDGEGGLFSAAEGSRAVEVTVSGEPVLGLGLAALTDGLVVTLASEERPSGAAVAVDVTYVDDDGLREEHVSVTTFAIAQEVSGARRLLVERVDRAVQNGAAIIARIAELFPRLRLGDGARSQIEALTGNETIFRQLVRHLRALDEGAFAWAEGSAYSPVAVSFSRESDATLTHGTYGPMRDFPTPEGFEVQRWSLHTKLTGGNGARMYFRAERVDGHPVVLVGYFGDHLPTVRYR